MDNCRVLCAADDDWQQLIADTLDDTTEDALNRGDSAAPAQEANADPNPIGTAKARSDRVKRGGS